MKVAAGNKEQIAPAGKDFHTQGERFVALIEE